MIGSLLVAKGHAGCRAFISAVWAWTRGKRDVENVSPGGQSALIDPSRTPFKARAKISGTSFAVPSVCLQVPMDGDGGRDRGARTEPAKDRLHPAKCFEYDHGRSIADKIDGAGDDRPKPVNALH